MSNLCWILYLSLAVASVAVGATKTKRSPTCAELLFIPPTFAAHFERYRGNLELLTPLEGFALDRLGPSFELDVYADPVVPPEQKSKRPVRIRAVGSDGTGPRGHLHLEGIDVSADLPPAYAYRVLFAHLLHAFPARAGVLIDVFETPALGEFKERLLAGQGPEDAWRATTLGEVAAEFGFLIDSVKVSAPPPADRSFEGQINPTVTLLGGSSGQPLGQ